MSKSTIYTGTGDAGTTSLVGGARIKKNDIRIEAYGSVDELNANLGVLATYPTLNQEAHDLIIYCQHKLMNIGAYLATPYPAGERHECPGIGYAAIDRIESAIDHLDANLPPLGAFVLPGGTGTAAQIHVCRTMCRRCERRIVSLADETYIDPLVLKFVNRLSDFLFVFARFNNVYRQVDEIVWDKNL